MIITRPLSILALLCALLSVSCSSTYTASGRIPKKGSVQVTHDAADSGDQTIRAAIRAELIQRGFTLTESNQSDLIARFSDTWRWDLLMYLSRMELTLADRRTGNVQAQGAYRNSAMHTFPSAKKVVSQIFTQMDEQGVFPR